MINATQFVSQIQAWGQDLGFSQIGIADVDLSSAEAGLLAWLAAGFHGDMYYMAAHGLKRARPAELQPGTVSVITARMDYLPRAAVPEWRGAEWQQRQNTATGIVSVYARGRDYHKVLRQRLQQLAERLAQVLTPLGYRVFTDSAPVLEVELAQRSGLGWRGKHTLLVHRAAGSMFFLGEIFLDHPLPLSQPIADHCGSCSACMRHCPTQAIVAPYRLDARRCISYLTIEHPGPIPVDLRPAFGNRVYGCDDCQLACPWNKFAQRSVLPDFDARAPMQFQSLLNWWQWSEAEFLRHTEGSPVRRIGYVRWSRNLAVALGNALRVAPVDDARLLTQALQQRQPMAEALVREHIDWALLQRGMVTRGG